MFKLVCFCMLIVSTIAVPTATFTKSNDETYRNQGRLSRKSVTSSTNVPQPEDYPPPGLLPIPTPEEIARVESFMASRGRVLSNGRPEILSGLTINNKAINGERLYVETKEDLEKAAFFYPYIRRYYYNNPSYNNPSYNNPSYYYPYYYPSYYPSNYNSYYW